MEDPTIELRLLPFEDVRNSTYSGARVNSDKLRDRILFVRTNQGNFAKLRVHSGPDLLITRLTVYGPAGCVIKTASNLVIHAGFSCNLDNAAETNVGADFRWHQDSANERWLEAQNAAAFHLWKNFPETTFADVSAAPYVNRRVERSMLTDQVLFARTKGGRFAKLHVWAGDALSVQRLTVFNANGTVHLDQSNLSIPGNGTLNLDTGQTNVAGADLAWQVEGPKFFLAPVDGAQLSYDSYFRFEKYLPLLRTASIRNALVYVDAGGTRAYDAWPDGDKFMLREFLHLREMDRQLPIPGPPPLIDERFISACAAKKIYLAHVSQSLWVEGGARVPWSLDNAGPTWLEHLFDMRRLLSFAPGKGHSFEQSVMGAVTHWSPSISFGFLEDNALIKTDQWKTIQAVTDWCRAHLEHIASIESDPDGPFPTKPDQWEHIFGYRGLPPVDKMLFPLPGRKHITQGCRGTDGFFAALLRTVNIPVRHGQSLFEGGAHSRPEFFTVGRNLAHGDNPYNRWTRLGHNNVPIHRMFLTNAQIESLIDSPAPLPGKTVPQTAGFHMSKHFAGLAVEFKTDTLLSLRCLDIAQGNTGHDMKVWEQLHDFHTDAEINAIVAQCDVAIAAIPGGCASI